MKLKVCLFGLLLLISVSCWDTHEALTVVKGKVTNQITGEGLSDIPVQLKRCSGGFMSITMCDSAKAVLTDQDGNFELRFLTEKGYYYKAGVYSSNRYLAMDHYGGLTLDEGKQNLLDFQVVPYVTIEAHLQVDKGGKNHLFVELQSTLCDKGWSGRPGLSDTARTNQLIDTVVYWQAIPLCHYALNKSLCNRSGLIHPYVFEDCEHSPRAISFYLDYVDTTRWNYTELEHNESLAPDNRFINRER